MLTSKVDIGLINLDSFYSRSCRRSAHSNGPQSVLRGHLCGRLPVDPCPRFPPYRRLLGCSCAFATGPSRHSLDPGSLDTTNISNLMQSWTVTSRSQLPSSCACQKSPCAGNALYWCRPEEHERVTTTGFLDERRSCRCCLAPL